MKSSSRFILNFPMTHYFNHKSKKYPFNFDIFKYFSKFFFREQSNYSKVTDIDLLTKEEEQQADLSDDSISNFIKFCQQQDYEINIENVICLNFLSTKYEVDELTKITNKYISEHQSDLRLKLISFRQKNFDNSTDLEQAISANLSDYVTNENFLSLPLSVIHRILLSNHDKQLREKNEFIDFLFKCIDKFGVGASALFEDIDFDKLPSKYQKKLLFEYSNKFDFHFINPSFTKSTYKMASELLEQQKILDNFQKDMETMNKSFNSKCEQQKNEEEQKYKHLNEQIYEFKEELKTKIQQQDAKDDEIKRQMSDEIVKLKNEMNQMNQKFISMIQEQKNNEEQKNRQLTNDINHLRDEMIRMNAVFDNVYPVGSIYMSVKNINPQNLFGGVWVDWGQGRVPVGVSSSGTFDSVEKTGGSETHTLTDSEMPNHGGHIPDSIWNWGSCSSETYFINYNKAKASGIFEECSCCPFVKYTNTITLRSFTKGSGNSHNNLQPYITCFMWKRTE